MAINQSEIFNAFKQDIKARNPQILTPPTLTKKINEATDPNLAADLRARSRAAVFDSVLRIIPIAVDRFGSPDTPPEELIGEAYETIDRCIENYDPLGGASFPGYVFTSLRRRLRDPQTIIDLEQPFYLPRDQQQRGYRIRRAFSPTAQQLQHEPSRDEWYQATEYNPNLQGWYATKSKEDFEHIHNLLIKKPYVHIGHEVGSGKIDIDHLEPKMGKIEEVLIDESSDFAKDIDNTINLKTDVKAGFKKLTTAQRFVVTARLSNNLTYAQIAEQLGLTISQTRAIMTQAERTLRVALRDYRYTE